jgi:DNA mismatch repair protein MutL
MPVRILPEGLVNKIAAGEVVERPASVVKELVENALDAGATVLGVHLRAGGRNLIRVVDDGAGMDRTDAVMALERHATSKILAEEDLFRVRSLGFRGEAIPSVASVSRFTLLTRRPGDEEGTRVTVEGGRLTDVAPAGCAVGTEVSVANLFFNVPARRKFLRSVETELGHCIEAVTREALIRPALDLEVTHDDRELLRCAPTDRPSRRAADLLGPHGEALVPVHFQRGNLEVEGLMSPVGVHRASPSGCSYLYVNGRFVKDAVVRRAVSQAYAGIVPRDRWPVVVLDIRVPVQDVDVNVHPAKTEVRFQHAFELQAAVAEGLRNALQEHGIRRPVVAEARYRPPEVAPAQVAMDLPRPTFTSSALGRAVEPPQTRPPPAAPAPTPPAPAPPTPPAPAPPAPVARPNALLPVARFRDLRVIGQLATTYVLCEGGGELVVVDQHAAHERITLWKLLRHRDAALGPTQRRLAPVLVRLPPARAQVLAAHAEQLAAGGLELAAMGGGTVAVHALPPALDGADLDALLADVADDLAEGGTGNVAGALSDHVLATMACHTSVRAGQRLDGGEMAALLQQLDEVDFSVCAHGRPVAIRVTSGELERRFHRT